jgi:hypothetical protein
MTIYHDTFTINWDLTKQQPPKYKFWISQLLVQLGKKTVYQQCKIIPNHKE